MFSVREETSDDYDAIRELTVDAFTNSEFGHNGEADFIEALRKSPQHLSLVASVEQSVVGHVMFSQVVMRRAEQERIGVGLAPMSVHPTHQRKGIGSSLVKSGLDRLFSQGCDFAVVLGHPNFYSRCGFRIAAETNASHGFAGIPQDCFLICWNPASHADADSGGLVYYDTVFGPQHEQ